MSDSDHIHTANSLAGDLSPCSIPLSGVHSFTHVLGVISEQ